MIYVQNHGRLGNQLFQYAFARKMQIERGDSIIMNFPLEIEFENMPNSYGNQLQYFNLTNDIIFSYQKKGFIYRCLNLMQRIVYFLYTRLRPSYQYWYLFERYQRLFMPILNKNGLYLQTYGYNEPQQCSFTNIMISGYYESKLYFSSIKDTLQQEFTPIFPSMTENSKLYEVINNKESVCVGIRCGDFLHTLLKPGNYVCTQEYYETAIQRMKKIYADAVFIFFSNDIKWCKEIFKNDTNIYYFEPEDNPVWETLRLMYLCKHFIISNSTLHWWAQFLSRNQNKTVIAPERWRNINDFEATLLEDEFIKIPIG